MTEAEQLQLALRWALKHGAHAVRSEYDGIYIRNEGCGCCSDKIEPPAEIAVLVNAVAAEVTSHGD
jgi:hypothetical protein